MNVSRIVVALDYPDAAKALALVDRLDPKTCRVKVGKELHTAAGHQLVDTLVRRGFDVFLDLKYHDIPNTVAAACKVAARQGVWMVNVHASGGSNMMRAAREALDTAGSSRPLLIAVTVLTSLADTDMAELGFSGTVAANVARMAGLAKDCGLDGVVCSAHEAVMLKASCGEQFKLVVPGIRLAGDAAGDQARVVTPVAAAKLGCDYLVIGRSITGALDPLAVIDQINASLVVDA